MATNLKRKKNIENANFEFKSLFGNIPHSNSLVRRVYKIQILFRLVVPKKVMLYKSKYYMKPLKCNAVKSNGIRSFLTKLNLTVIVMIVKMAKL